MCGEPISSSPSATSTRFTGIFLPRAADRVQRGEQRRLRPLLVDRAAADHHLADAGLVDDARLERRRAPLGRIELLDVVHEVEADGLRRAGIERGEHARLAVGVERSRPSGSRRRAPASPCIRRPRGKSRFSAAIDGSAIQSCSRLTDSSWRFVDLALGSRQDRASRPTTGRVRRAERPLRRPGPRGCSCVVGGEETDSCCAPCAGRWQAMLPAKK